MIYNWQSITLLMYSAESCLLICMRFSPSNILTEPMHCYKEDWSIVFFLIILSRLVSRFYSLCNNNLKVSFYLFILTPRDSLNDIGIIRSCKGLIKVYCETARIFKGRRSLKHPFFYGNRFVWVSLLGSVLINYIFFENQSISNPKAEQSYLLF